MPFLLRDPNIDSHLEHTFQLLLSRSTIDNLKRPPEILVDEWLWITAEKGTNTFLFGKFYVEGIIQLEEMPRKGDYVVYFDIDRSDYIASRDSESLGKRSHWVLGPDDLNLADHGFSGNIDSQQLTTISDDLSSHLENFVEQHTVKTYANPSDLELRNLIQDVSKLCSREVNDIYNISLPMLVRSIKAVRSREDLSVNTRRANANWTPYQTWAYYIREKQLDDKRDITKPDASHENLVKQLNKISPSQIDYSANRLTNSAVSTHFRPIELHQIICRTFNSTSELANNTQQRLQLTTNAEKKHQQILHQLTDYFISKGKEPLFNKNIDLAIRCNHQGFFLFEIKSMTEENAAQQIKAGVFQLLYYAFHLREAGELIARSFLVSEGDYIKDYEQFLKSVGIHSIPYDLKAGPPDKLVSFLEQNPE